MLDSYHTLVSQLHKSLYWLKKVKTDTICKTLFEFSAAQMRRSSTYYDFSQQMDLAKETYSQSIYILDELELEYQKGNYKEDNLTKSDLSCFIHTGVEHEGIPTKSEIAIVKRFKTYVVDKF